MSFMFGAYDWYAKQLMNFQVFRTHSNSSQPTMMAEVCAALLAGSTEGLLAPLERAQTLLQTPHFHEHYENTWDALKKLRPYGFSEYYRYGWWTAASIVLNQFSEVHQQYSSGTGPPTHYFLPLEPPYVMWYRRSTARPPVASFRTSQAVPSSAPQFRRCSSQSTQRRPSCSVRCVQSLL